MKKLSILLIILLIAGWMVACAPEVEEANTEGDYATAVAKFKEVSITEAREAAAEGVEFFLYIGYEGCPFCEKLVPLLAEAQEKYDINIYYADAEQKKEPDFVEFMMEYDFKKVPTLFEVKDKSFNLIKIKSPYTMEKVEGWLGLK